ncbi:MAG: FHA domain-containing protein [Streptosporangiales bacterium]|nr:FHA domain-containing protein [Streptosporangiales bacterium]
MTNRIELLAQAAYEAHRAAIKDDLPLWEDLTENEQYAWKAAVTVVAGPGGDTASEPPAGRALTVKVGDQRYTFRTDFIVGREGGLEIDDDFASGHHARFQTVRGLWYVEDLGSTNGTEVNGRRVMTAQVLKKRDKVTIGHTVMTVVSV